MTNGNPFQPSPGDALPAGANPEGTQPPVPLEVSAVLERSWELLQRSPGVMAATILIPAIPQLVGSIGSQFLQAMMQRARSEDEIALYAGLALVVQLVTTLVALWLTLGQVRIVTRLVRGLDAEALMLFNETPKYPGAIVAWFLMGTAIVAGTCLFVIPGMIAAIGLSFTFYALVDQDLGPVDALSESWRLTEGYKLQLFLVSLVVSLGALVAGCATLGVGFFVAVPLLVLVQGVMYHSLLHLQPKPR